MTRTLATGPDRSAGTGSGARGSWALRDRPAVLWLALAVLVALVHPFVPSSRWLMVHLLLLGALTHAIMVWSTHFAQALLKTPPTLDDRRVQSRRLLLLLTGSTLVLVGVPTSLTAVTLAGAVLTSAAVVWHGIQLWRRLRRALPGRFRITIRYYLAAAACLPLGATLGTVLARGPGEDWHGRLLVAHTMVNLLGWVGLTLTGTLVTLWPTMLRTRIDERAERLARQALPVLVLALLLIVGAALAGSRPAVVAGIVLYAAGLAWWGRALLRPALARPPREFATASVAAALLWLVVGIVGVGVTVATSGSWGEVAGAFGALVAVFAVGFAGQLLPGALSYLLPVAVGGGPSVVRAGGDWFDRWGTARLLLVNGGLVLCLLPVPSAVRVTASVLVLGGLAAFLPLMVGGLRAAVRAGRDGAPPGPAPAARAGRTIWSPGQVVAALSALAVAVSVGVGMDPAAAGLGGGPLGARSGGAAAPAAQVQPTGETTTVRVEAHDMEFVPDSVTVPAGDRLVVELVNKDPATTHDLTLGGVTSDRLGLDERASMDIGVVSGDLDGWCTVIGHRRLGMTFTVLVEGAAPRPPADAGATEPGESGNDGDGDEPGDEPVGVPGAVVQEPVDPVLPALTDETLHRITLRAQEVELEVAPGVTQRRWTFGGSVPGPTLHGRVGDVFEVTLVNDGTMGHSIDFHAGALAPDEPMRTIAPGETLTYRFTAERSGIWMYHCSTAPMSAHIAAGMFGAVVIEPADLPAVDRSYVLVQSEAYLEDGDGVAEVDLEAVQAARPDAVTFNGIANQYDQHPLRAEVGERVRIWVLDAGPTRATSFHVVGGQFDTVYSEGGYLLRDGADPFGGESGGSQALGLQPAQGGFVELAVPEAGHYPVVSHVMIDAERGAHGILEVTEPDGRR